MWEQMIALFVVSVLSAFFPLINIEVYIAGLYLLAPTALWTAALVGAIGQTVGKIVWYYVGAHAQRWPWLAAKMERPAFKTRSEKWRASLADRQWIAAAVMFASGLVGLPPLAIMAVVAGHLRMKMWIFVVTVLTGRFLRFAVAMGAAATIGDWLRR
ncbi:MAG: VTT domain-containing protein [Actinomycetia bacterium]|nr:VTT domain-containing protein [Actinomycetes bacterium]